MNYTTYERPIDLYSDCQNYFIGIIENNPDKDLYCMAVGILDKFHCYRAV